MDPWETEVVLDGTGHLRELHWVPARDLFVDETDSTGGDRDEKDSSDWRANLGPSAETREAREEEVFPIPKRSFPWNALLEEAGLDPSQLVDITPKKGPADYADDLLAWRGMLGGHPIYIHAASLGGRPVWFEVQSVAAEDEDEDKDHRSFATVALMLGLLAVLGTLGLVAVMVVRAGWRLIQGQGDLPGARRIGTVTFVAQVVAWILIQQAFEILDFITWGLFFFALSVLVGLLYLVLEPHARSRYPQSLVSWTRFLRGRWRDPIVGRDVLVGTVAGVVSALALPFAAAATGETGTLTEIELDGLLGARFVSGTLIAQGIVGLGAGLATYAVFSSLQRVLRFRGLAIGFFHRSPIACHVV